VVKDVMEELYIKYYKELYLYAFSLCKDHHLAQDLTSDTFFKAYLSLEDQDAYIKYWLFKVCRNLFIDLKRKDKEYLFDDDIERVEDKEVTPLYRMIENERKWELFQEILKLNESYKEVLILYYYCDFSVLEISESKKLNEGTVKTLLFRGRKKLKKGLEDNNGL